MASSCQGLHTRPTAPFPNVLDSRRVLAVGPAACSATWQTKRRSWNRRCLSGSTHATATMEVCNRGRETFLVASVVQMHASKSRMLSVPWYLNGHWEAPRGRCVEVWDDDASDTRVLLGFIPSFERRSASQKFQGARSRGVALCLLISSTGRRPSPRWHTRTGSGVDRHRHPQLHRLSTVSFPHEKACAKRLSPLPWGSKWLCEEHIPLPWKHDVCDAAGVPCLCNRRQVVRRLRVFEGVPRVDRRISKVFDRRVLDRRTDDCGLSVASDRRQGGTSPSRQARR